MSREQIAEKREIDMLRAFARGEPSAAAWDEITSAVRRYIKRKEQLEESSLGLPQLDVMTSMMTSLRALESLPPGGARRERARELLDALEATARAEYVRFDSKGQDAASFIRIWKGVFEELDGLLAHWPDELRALTEPTTSLLRTRPHGAFWPIFRHVELGALTNLVTLHAHNPHLTFTLRKTRLSKEQSLVIPAVRRLELSSLMSESIGNLTKHSSWSALREIALYNMELGVDTVRAMAGSGMFEGLELLSLRHCELSPAAVAELVEHLDPSIIEHLDLTSTSLGRAGLEHLLSLSAARPRYLDLTDCDLDTSAIKRFARAKFTQAVLHLGLSSNAFDDDGVAAIASSSKFVGLRELELRGVRLNDDAAFALADSVHLLDLRELDVRDNRLTESGLVRLATSPYLDRLDLLHVEGNHIDRRTWKRLTGEEVAHAPLRAHLASQRGG